MSGVTMTLQLTCSLVYDLETLLNYMNVQMEWYTYSILPKGS